MDPVLPGKIRVQQTVSVLSCFSHPDYTVGSGIAPDQRRGTHLRTCFARGLSPPVRNFTSP